MKSHYPVKQHDDEEVKAMGRKNKASQQLFERTLCMRINKIA